MCLMKMANKSEWREGVINENENANNNKRKGGFVNV